VSILGAANVLANTAATLPGAAPGLVSVLDLPTTRLRRSDPSVSYQITDSVPGDMKLSSGTPK
jgi:hypothetical protein